jgi:exodeoxyribonuclease VII small subunit
MKNTTTYKKAFDELSNIVEEIDNEKVQVDALTEKINRAIELIGFCQSKLRTTEEEFKKALEKLKK